MSVRPMRYAFPDDDDATLDAVLASLPDERAAEMIVHGFGLSQLRLTELTAATYLALLLDTDDRKTDPTSSHPYTLTVADEARPTCDAYLKDADPKAVWQPFVLAAPFNKPAQRDFENAWLRLAGPNLI